MYGYQGGPPYGRPPSYGGYPQPGAPGMGPPPGMGAAPGTGPAPGMDTDDTQQQSAHGQASGRGGPSGFPPNFQPPANMPNINFNAPVIRLGTSGPPATGSAAQGGDASSRRDNENSRQPRAGLGMEVHAQRQAMRDNMAQLTPPTKDEIARTLFIGGITEGAGGDEGVQSILRSTGNLRRWIRATDADGKACRFGFAEYEDPESLFTAVEVLKDVQIPVRKQNASTGQDAPQQNGVKAEDLKDDDDADDAKVESSQLLVMVDDATYDYLSEWESSRGETDATQAQQRLDNARSSLASALAAITHPSTISGNEQMSKIDANGNVLADGADGTTDNTNGESAENAQVITIPLSADDELADVPAEMREQVAKEIQAFRDRSVRRDLERLKREEEIEAMERRRNEAGPRASRLASPPPATAGASGGRGGGGVNGIPQGPRDRNVSVSGAHDSAVSFVNGTGIHGAGGSAPGLLMYDRSAEESDASDDELERRRVAKRSAEQEQQYQDQARRWLNRERSRTAALEREKAREREDEQRSAAARSAMQRRLKDWDDGEESRRRVEAYYADRSQWIRTRAVFRQREAHADEADRAAEQRERAREEQQAAQAKGMADDFLSRHALEMGGGARESAREEHQQQQQQQQQPFKLSLGAAAAQKAAQQAAASMGKHRTTAAEVEGLLEDEEEGSTNAKRTLIPISYDAKDASSSGGASGAHLSEEERQQAARQLAADIPSDRDGLWSWPVQWDYVDESVLTDQLRPFVEKKIVEYLGVQEQMLVEVAEEHVRKHGQPADLVGELEGALDEEAENLVKKLWRMIIFFSESEKRGISV